MTITIGAARAYLVRYHGLDRPRSLSGKKGVMSFLRKVSSIQFDPIDIVGKNPDLVLQSRVKRYSPRILETLLYKDRALIEHFDKELCVYLIEDWPHFDARRKKYLNDTRGGTREKPLFKYHRAVLRHFDKHGPASSTDIDLGEAVTWYWGTKTKLSRAALEHMYYSGLVSIHHRTRGRKYYDSTERIIPESILSRAADASRIKSDDHNEWMVMRRIASVGLLWNKSGSAWLGVCGAPERKKALDRLIAKNKIVEVSVEGIKTPFYAPHCAVTGKSAFSPIAIERAKASFIAPLDNMIWDRSLIRELFGFDYTWEIYKPKETRKFGYYVLPVLYGNEFIARVEPLVRDGKLMIANWWNEESAKKMTASEKKRAVTEIRIALDDFALYLDVEPCGAFNPFSKFSSQNKDKR